ncbi:MAG TPA: hypothetical protein VGN63_19580 [Flavisolibacter sp.]|jgi:mannose/fructose-specific phosphotransferase system component IIA|nr:hypothetical protein [Flavisolibacter sp.]
MAKGVKGSTPTDLNRPERTTIISTHLRLEKLRYIAFMEKTDMTSIMNEQLDKVIAKYEKEHGEIPVK